MSACRDQYPWVFIMLGQESSTHCKEKGKEDELGADVDEAEVAECSEGIDVVSVVVVEALIALYVLMYTSLGASLC